MKFFLRHFDSLDNAEKFAAMGDPNPLAVFDAENRKRKIIDQNLLHRPCRDNSGEEQMDIKMKTMPEEASVCYASLYDMDDEGVMPDDLTATETILTKLLWGEISRTRAVLLVAALENMDASLIEEQLDKIGLF